MELPEEFGYEGLQRVCFACIPVIEGKTRGQGTIPLKIWPLHKITNVPHLSSKTTCSWKSPTTTS